MMAKRYFRRTPLSREEDLVDPIFAEKVEWLLPFGDEFYQISATVSLNQHELYKRGRIVGMDAASIATVWALQLEPSSSCIDTCCAPGMKLMLISDFTKGLVVGLDVNKNRLDVCRSLLGKFGYSQRLQSNVLTVSSPEWTVDLTGVLGEGFSCSVMKKKKDRNGKKRKRVLEDEAEKAKEEARVELVKSVGKGLLFDRVLVDAECTHDGSQRHLWKHVEVGAEGGDDGEGGTVGFWNRFGKTEKNREFYDDPSKIQQLSLLQRRLILNGFNLLKPGGFLVYSTCSLRKEQNEEIVNYLLEEMPTTARPATLPFTDTVPATRLNSYSCLFDPAVSGTSGQFIAVLTKLAPE